jgi:plasmid stabilization system protein ParE
MAHVAVDNPAAAKRIAERVDEVRSFLSENPNAGYKLPHSRLRRFPIGPFPYLMYFRSSKYEVRIIRIRHAARYRPAFHEPAPVFAR